jgi:hypothetical protein
MADAVTVRAYLLSLPERVVRSAVGVSAGVVREAGQLALPKAVRRSQLYQNQIEALLRFLIEYVGGVDGVYETDEQLARAYLARRLAGNALEALGIIVFHKSPIFVLAVLADGCGAGRHLIPEISEALKAQGLLDKDTQFTTVEQLLDGLERTSARLIATVSSPPLDVAALRQEWDAIRAEVRSIPAASLPSRDALRAVWTQLQAESARQNRSVFEMSSMLAVDAAGKLPDGLRWLSASARSATARTSRVFAAALLEHYAEALAEVRQVGYGRYAVRQLRPYMRAAARQFSPAQRTVTDRLIDTYRRRRLPPERTGA